MVIRSRWLGVSVPAAMLTIGTVASSVAAPIQWTSGAGGNDHYYEVVQATGPISWTAARAGAEAHAYLGMQGYLVTITSAAENAFITAHFNSNDAGHWIGASDAGTEGTWLWVTGPEAGTQFWQGNQGGATTAPFNYANWIPGAEPNNAGGVEDYAHILFDNPGGAADGTWNDFADNGSGFIDSYLVEYGPASVSVPEPGTLAILGLGLAGLGLRRRERKAD